MTRYIFITGGVVSSLGKGITSGTIGTLLQAHGFNVKLRKLDPYLNIDPGTMSPSEHGEVFVTDDGTEGDLDLGHYERFTGINTTRNDSITTGRIYDTILRKERKGSFLGKTIQVIPHVTNTIKEFITNDTTNYDFVMIEIGGTVGDIEALPFFEAIRQLGFELGRNKTCFIHLTYLPYIEMAEELKTKPTQHSVKTLQSLGIQPDILMCRADVDIPKKEIKKISQFCNVDEKSVIPALNAKHIYQVPLLYHGNGLDTQILKHLSMQENKINLKIWKEIDKKISNINKTIQIAIVGKYTKYKDSYKSIIEALNHGGLINNVRIEIIWIESREIQNESDLKSQLKDATGIIVPGGFGADGIEGKIIAVKYARENNIPYFGICLGMQIAVIEFAKNVLKITDANSIEFDGKTKNNVIGLIEEWNNNGKKEKRDKNSDFGGTMRVGGYDAKLKKNTLIHKIYGKDIIRERHRHRYEVNTKYREQFEERGLIFSGVSIDEILPECIELKNHRFFVGVQFHPELTSRPFDVNPLFKSFVNICYN